MIQHLLILMAGAASTPPAAVEDTAETAVPEKTVKVIYKTGDSAEVDKGDPNQTICKKMPPPPGTRLGKRQICKSRADWASEKSQIKAEMDRQQTRSPGPPAG